MEYGNTRRITNQPNLISAKPQDSFRQFSQARLATLISINKETAYENSLYNSTKEIEEETLLKNPLSVESAFSYFGLLIGTITPTAIFTRFSLEARIFHGDDLWILGIFAIVNLITVLAFELAVLLKDSEMLLKLKQNFPEILPNNSNFAGAFLEYELWNTEIHEELQTSQI